MWTFERFGKCLIARTICMKRPHFFGYLTVKEKCTRETKGSSFIFKEDQTHIICNPEAASCVPHLVFTVTYIAACKIQIMNVGLWLQSFFFQKERKRENNHILLS